MHAISKTCDEPLHVRFSLTLAKDEFDSDINSECDNETFPGFGQHNRVRFASTVRIHHIPKLSLWEIKDAWISLEEMEDIKRECTFTIHCMESANMQCFLKGEDAKFEPRGLEHQTKVGKSQKDKMRHEARRAVIWEQCRQDSLGIYDGEAIAREYKRMTGRSIQLARAFGICDHLATLQ